jgi:hypothetical protein
MESSSEFSRLVIDSDCGIFNFANNLAQNLFCVINCIIGNVVNNILTSAVEFASHII